ncbi:beta-L-arabinofuranosidase domain-containing protein [Amycolatopsis suaedae]|uniref:Transcriptional initiation protein Tat n=1 Tax=Amycolatopsis suaedae TaxID=2510978 RepID=A0A4Q7J0S7_9PSEU|nr:beta-L-arabinofuranosidase domain-containing protein [Amycolatopsis suaedae]RZQ60960.1 transcriptional initiation protein Tat [Amycolatopsis suaedae]
MKREPEFTSVPVGRRRFLGGLALAGAALALPWQAHAAPEGMRGGPRPSRGGHYVPNRAPLQPVPFQKLPPGAVRPRGWLRQQLDLQIHGLAGRFDEVSGFLVYDTNGWVNPRLGAWEELPYWLRGLGDLGYVTGDQGILGKAERWIQGIMATQAADGWFGPEGLRTSLEGGPDFWPGMPLLGALRSWQEYSGDDRVVPFMTRYFDFQNRQPAEVFNRSWGAFRWGDNIDSVYWLYNRTGEGWLLDLATKMHRGSADYTTGIPTWHNVNLAQGFREPLQYGLLAGDARFREATYRNYGTVMSRYGQFAGGGFAGDENCRPGFGDPRQGFETCGIVEFMHSFQLLTRFTADTSWADRCEDLAFNLLPASYDAEQRVLHYVTSANSVQLDDGLKHGQFQNGFPMQAYKPGIHEYRCCPHNYGMGWPYFTEELWLATCDGGLAASMYSPSEVRAVVGEGTEVVITEDTEYPFDEQVRLTVTTPKPVAFPLYLRIPHWARGATVQAPGAAPVPAAAGQWSTVDRTWHSGDVLTLRLPMRITTRRWHDNHDSVSVDRGPLTYSLEIGERVERFGGTPEWPALAVYPTSPWNYGLVTPGGFDVERRPVSGNPFTHDGAPVRLRAQAKRIAEWEADSENVVGLLQPSPARSDAPAETVTLIPMGAARLRITSFPTTPAGGGGHRWQRRPHITASHVYQHDSYEAVNDGRTPAGSGDQSIPRFTWWDRRGSTEWIQWDLREPRTIGQAAVYWFDDTGVGQCRVPASWRVLWLDGETWRPVPGAGPYGTDRDRDNVVRFDPVHARFLRVEAVLRPGFSGGILEMSFTP